MTKALRESGTLVTYGAMARQPLRVPNGLLIFQDIRFRGFWVTRWYRESSRASRETLFADLIRWTLEGNLRSPVAAVYPLERIREALQHAQQDFRSGKILLRPSSAEGANQPAE
jgi:NADPH:quinone reductase-like Zn-dependent oxidoreductase